jgi:hypothetical protein
MSGKQNQTPANGVLRNCCLSKNIEMARKRNKDWQRDGLSPGPFQTLQLREILRSNWMANPYSLAIHNAMR